MINDGWKTSTYGNIVDKWWLVHGWWLFGIISFFPNLSYILGISTIYERGIACPTNQYIGTTWGFEHCSNGTMRYFALLYFCLVIYTFNVHEYTIPQTIFLNLGLSKYDSPSIVYLLVDSFLVGGLEHQFYFPIYWVYNHPNWLSYFSEGWPNHQPGRFRPSELSHSVRKKEVEPWNIREIDRQTKETSRNRWISWNMLKLCI